MKTETLELKHLAPYLPYKLRVLHTESSREGYFTSEETIETLSHECVCFVNSFNSPADYYYDEIDVLIKPILRPLSDLTKEILFEENIVIPFDVLNWDIEFTNAVINNIIPVLGLAYSDIEYLQKLHFDVFGLIPKGLAVDVNIL